MVPRRKRHSLPILGCAPRIGSAPHRRFRDRCRSRHDADGRRFRRHRAPYRHERRARFCPFMVVSDSNHEKKWSATTKPRPTKSLSSSCARRMNPEIAEELGWDTAEDLLNWSLAGADGSRVCARKDTAGAEMLDNRGCGHTLQEIHEKGGYLYDEWNKTLQEVRKGNDPPRWKHRVRNAVRPYRAHALFVYGVGPRAQNIPHGTDDGACFEPRAHENLPVDPHHGRPFLSNSSIASIDRPQRPASLPTLGR